MQALFYSNLPELKLIKRGKVRDLYDLGEYYLIVSTDRLSAFDVIMNEPIPYKGIILTQISKFWLEFTSGLAANHFISDSPGDYPSVCKPYTEQLRGRSMLVKKVKIIPLECIIRGYISGSGWNDYKATGSICGITLPPRLIENQKLPQIIFTPSTKAEIGEHDENISREKAAAIIGESAYIQLEKLCLDIYSKCSEYAHGKGIIIADTKLEFGMDENGNLILADEILTPDSSRFWPAENFAPGMPQDSFDKQFVRDYLISIGFNKQPPPPVIPDEIIKKTTDKYVQAFEIITGREFEYAA